MAKFSEIQFEALGEFIIKILKDPDLRSIFENGTQEEIKNRLSDFMTPRGKTWGEITIVPHFDEENVVHISFPFRGDVEETLGVIAPEDGNQPGEDYPFPDHYHFDPNTGGSNAEKKASRLRAYRSRIGDYVMSRCR
jgi:hypothetical protein